MGTPSLARRIALITLALVWPLGPAAAAPSGAITSGSAPPSEVVGLRAGFDTGPQGFTSDGERARWAATGGAPGGHVYDEPDGPGDTAPLSISSPVSWSGDRSAAFRGRLSVSFRATSLPDEEVRVVVTLASPAGSVSSGYIHVPDGDYYSTDLILSDLDAWGYEGPDGSRPAGSGRIRRALTDLEAVVVSVDRDADPEQRLSVDEVELAGWVPRTVRMRSTSRAFAGQVRAERIRCVRDVEVLVQRRLPDRFVTVARTRTDDRGEWSVGRRLGPGDWVARVHEEFRAGTGDCAAARTRIRSRG